MSRTTDQAERPLLLLGGGGHAAVVADAAGTAGWTIAGFLDDEATAALSVGPAPAPRLGSIDDLHRWCAGAPVAPAIHAATGDAARRRRWLELASDLPAPAIIHARAIVAESATIGAGAFIGPGAIVNARARVERGAIVNSGAIVEHDGRVGAYSHVAPGAVLAGRVTLGEACFVGAGSVVIPGVALGDGAVLGAGAVAIADLGAGLTAVGVPARVREVTVSPDGSTR
jgi:sugar O-acyltransferase (sialic acid O-acetyltransferase NeuD family)